MKRPTILLVSCVALLRIAPAASAQQEIPRNDPHSNKTAQGLINVGNEHRTQKKYDEAIKYYDYAIAKAQKEQGLTDDQRQKLSAKAISLQAICNEEMEPPQVDRALALYNKIVSEYPNVPRGDLGAVPPEKKLEMKGVDINLSYLRKQLTGVSKIEDIKRLKSEAWGKIQPLDAAAVPGLINAFSSPEQPLRDFAAEKLHEVVDEKGIAAAIDKLREPSLDVRNAAQFALSGVIDRYLRAKRFDEEAELIEAGMKPIEVPEPHNKAEIILNEAKKLRQKATEVRHNIPPDIGSRDVIMKTVEDLLTGDLPFDRKVSAAAVVEKLREASPSIEQALIKNFAEKSTVLRIGCAKALGALGARAALPKMHELLLYEPEKAPPDQPIDRSNTDLVRREIAEALARIGSMLSIPPLIKALDDDKEGVRSSAIYALMSLADTKDQFEITGNKALAYRPDALPEERRKQIELWQKWWDDTKGVKVLVDRFALFALRWVDFSAADLFSPAPFLRNVDRRIRYNQEHADAHARAEKVIAIFEKMKKPHKEAVKELQADAIPHLLKMLGGEIDRTKGKPEPAVSRFVAEILAEEAAKPEGKALIGALQKIVGGGDGASPARRAGGLIALSRLPKEMISPDIVATIEGGLTGDNGDMIVMAAECLAALKSTGSLSRLSDALVTSQNEKVKLAVIQAIIDLDQKEKTAVANLSTLAADPKSVPVIAEHAVIALGTTGDIDALPAIITCRISIHPTVTAVTAAAIKQLPKEQAVKMLREALKNDKETIRRSAALLLGDLEEPGASEDLIRILIDVRPPKLKKDLETRVRRAAADALGRIKPQSTDVVSALITALEDPDDDVRDLSFKALVAITGEEKIEFKPKDNERLRIEQIKKWRQWFTNNAGNLFKKT